MDEDYHRKIISLLPSQTKVKVKKKVYVPLELLRFMKDMFFHVLRWIFFCRIKRAYNVNKIIPTSKDTEKMRKTIKFYASNSTKIEIFKDGKLYPYYFPKLPYCTFHSDEVKDEFMEHVNRSNAKTKCEDLTRNSGQILIQLRVDHFFRNNLGRLISY